MSNEVVKGYILVHPPPKSNNIFYANALCFDVVVHKDYYEKYKFLSEDLLYSCKECVYAKAFLSKFKDYVYLGSEDLCHEFHFNVSVLLAIIELAKENFKITVV